jgi:hypothetical protein
LVKIRHFLRNNVFKWEAWWARCAFIGQKRSLNAWTNTPLEGTNRGLKHGLDRVSAQMSLAESTKKITLQDGNRHNQKIKDLCRNYHGRSQQNVSTTSNYIQPEAESELQSQIKASERFISLRVKTNEFLLLAYGKKAADPHVPDFINVRSVKIVNGKLECDCYWTADFGVPCRHMSHILKYYSLDEFKGYSVDDIDMRYHCNFSYFCVVKDPNELTRQEKQIADSLVAIRCSAENRMTMPKARKLNNRKKFAVGTASGMENPNYLLVKEEIERVLKGSPMLTNYTKEDLDDARRVCCLGPDFRFEVQIYGGSVFDRCNEGSPVIDESDEDMAMITQDDPESGGDEHILNNTHDYSVLSPVNPQKGVRKNAYDAIREINIEASLKAMAATYDNLPSSDIDRMMEILADAKERIDKGVQEGQAKRALLFPQDKGKRVLPMARNVNTRKRQRLQRERSLFH